MFVDVLNLKQPEIFESVFHKFYAPLCYYANKFVRDEETAKDIVNEVFLRFWESKGKFENQWTLKAFLYNCVRNAAINYLEKMYVQKNKNRYLQWNLMDEEEAFCFQVQTDIFEEIFIAIEELPEECKRIFKMSYIEMLDIKTICEQLNIAETTVKTQRSRAKKYLRNRLQHLFPIAVMMFF